LPATGSAEILKLLAAQSGRLVARLHAELGQDRRHVVVDRLLREEQPLRCCTTELGYVELVVSDPGSAPRREAAALAAIADARVGTEGLIESLARQWADIVEASALNTGDDEHDPEGATVAFERAQVQGMLDQARTDLTDLDQARIRVREGTYWTCAQCAGPIAEERLAALPATRTCIRCANKARR
jgi:DnaK suppressor protein